MFLGMDIYTWLAIVVIALIVTFLPVSLPVKIILGMAGTACFYFGRKYYCSRKEAKNGTGAAPAADYAALAAGILKALGGKGNITKVDYCATRLRVEVNSYAAVNEAAVRDAGAVSVIRLAKNACQVVLKSDVQAVYDAMRKLL